MPGGLLGWGGQAHTQVNAVPGDMSAGRERRQAMYRGLTAGEKGAGHDRLGLNSAPWDLGLGGWMTRDVSGKTFRGEAVV